MIKNLGIIKKNNGVTLLELMLYTSLAAIILLTISIFLSTTLVARIKNQTVYEVEQQGSQVMELITQAIREAKSINSPPIGSSSATLSLGMADSSKNPTIFSVSSGSIQIQEGAAVPTTITSNRTNVSNLVFSNVSRNNTPGSIRVEFILEHVNPGQRNEYKYSQAFYRTASLR